MAAITKILVVDDSAFMRLLLSDILAKDASLEVIGTANNGKEAVEQAKKLKPDVVLMDMIMEEYDGIYAVREIMKNQKVPILILSAVGNTDLSPIFEALKLGAVDYINKPSRNNAKLRLMEDELIHKIKHVARAKPTILAEPVEPSQRAEIDPSETPYELCIIGASTGGPSAVERVIKGIPVDFPVPVIVAQHMPSNFIDPFVHRLDNASALTAVKGMPGVAPRVGMIVVMPGNLNLKVIRDKSTGHLMLKEDPKTYPNFNHPSINALFHSQAEVCGAKSISVILTGMGKDGVTGIKAVYDAGGYTIAQNEQTSVIFGMPKGAIATGGVKEVLPIFQISQFLCEIVKSSA